MKLLIGISGGLDSTYAAYLLRTQGHIVEGATLVMHDHSDVESARFVCQSLGIPLHELDCRESFEKEVIAPFVAEYQNGRTPNPCVVCNRYVKIEKLCEFARKNGFDGVVTGHYARIEKKGERYCVRMAHDRKKDQSYMLWQLTQDQLSLLQTPLCDMSKQEIRAKAIVLGLPSVEKKESQDICFLPNGDYVSFVEAHVGVLPPGDFVRPDGTVLGKHKGLLRYTVGQRKGLGIAAQEPLFVKRIDAATNTVTLTVAQDLNCDTLIAKNPNFVAVAPPKEETTVRLLVKTRYGAQPAPATVTYDTQTVRIVFDTPQRAITPGQSVVCYDDDTLVLGAVIS